MKRLVAGLTMLLLLAGGAFAIGFEIGPTAMLRFPFAVEDSLAAFEGLGPEDFKLGADVELMIGPLQVGALCDFRPGREEGPVRMPAAVEMLVTGGLLLDLAILRIGASVGPTVIIDVPGPDAPPPPPGAPGRLGLGLGVKANADLKLGRIALRLNAITGLDILRIAAADDALQYVDMRIGLSLLFALL
jgi:hypothetical protein